MAIFTHVVLGTNDIDKARKFYDSTLGALGLKRVMNMENASLWGKDGPEFMVTKPANGQPATPANGRRPMPLSARPVSCSALNSCR